MESKATYQYLKDDIYYNELYDRLTIETCRRWESKKDNKKLVPPKEDENLKLSDIKYKKWSVKVVLPIAVNHIKGERYTKKGETIGAWKERDREKDEHLANAQIPRGARCLECSFPVDCISRDLHTDSQDKERVLFMFECSKCHKRRAYWEDRQEWVPRKNPCPKCRTGMESKSIREGNLIKTEYTCPGCSYSETNTWDLDKKKENAIDPNFESDRKKYCLSNEEGMRYIDGAEKLKHVIEMMKDHTENKELYDAVAKIKKLTIVELQNLLNPLIEGASYTRFELGKLDMTRDVVMEFSLQDNKRGRTEYDSVQGLQKIIRNALEETNWRLMSEGITYRLGFLSGRLRGVEGEEALTKLTGLQKKET